MKLIKIAKLIILINFLYYIVYNTYFGWNFHSLTQIESICDSIYLMINEIAIVLYIFPLFSLYESTIENRQLNYYIKNDRK